MKRWQVGKEKHFWFLMVIILGIFFVSALAVLSIAGANGSPLVEIEADFKQMKSELGQVKKGLGEIKKNLENREKKLTEDLKSMDKKLVDLQKMYKSNFFWLLIIAIIALAIALSALVVVLITRWKNLYQR